MLIKNFHNLGFITNHLKENKIGIILIYTVGAFGLLTSFSFPIFLKLIPFALVLSFIAIAIFHGGPIDKKIILTFCGIYITGFIIEAIGVNTKLVFGSYQYGQSLGIELFHTPLIIGLNWVLLVYLSSSVLENLNLRPIFKIVLASFIMLGYDIVLEKVAPKIDLWHWTGDSTPIQNNVAWFIISLFFNSLIKGLRINTQNRLALTVLICQFLFFFNLFLFFK
jgi:bisanhydrobacterioruberin hydratase